MVCPFDTWFSLFLLSFLLNYLLLRVLQMPPPVLLLPLSTRFPSYLIYAIRTKENVYSWDTIILPYRVRPAYILVESESAPDPERSWLSAIHTGGLRSGAWRHKVCSRGCSMGEYFGGAGCKPRDWMALIILTNVCLTWKCFFNMKKAVYAWLL